jgi:hypothetical protein
MSTITCNWVLFASQTKECLSCENYHKCLIENEKRDPDRILRSYLKTIAVVEDDAKEFADLLREQDKLDLDELYTEESQGLSDKTIEDIKNYKSYKELAPIAYFLDGENIPFNYIPPNELYASTFLMITFSSLTYTMRLSSLSGVSKDIKMVNRLYKARNNRVYKYLKKGTLDMIFPIIKNLIYYRKSHAA